ncbi:26S proteasome subunit Rpn8 [Acrasis kona]|uniref:26S proteasome subunit Rpn8 n=1 Tax=Acrasis kona TaxID=1008807 RepID=A0AAW2ZQ03_9EUKA
MSQLAAPSKVVVHPLVLLSVVDHYNRVAKDTNNRVTGVLLGEINAGVVDVTNSFAVPFEEDPKDPSIWFLDHNYLDGMFAMFRKVNAREKIVGWYSTGPKIRKSDIDIHEVFRDRYLKNPVYVIIDVKVNENVIPTDAYMAIEEKEDEKSQPTLTFAHLPSEIGALEAEEIGVEHLLRDVKDTTVSDLASSVTTRFNSLRALRTRLNEVHKYLELVEKNKLPINHHILYLLQDVFNLLPGLQDAKTQEAFTSQTNDSYMAMYLSSAIRSVVALNNLINNKLDLRDAEKEPAKPAENEKKDSKDEKKDDKKDDKKDSKK